MTTGAFSKVSGNRKQVSGIYTKVSGSRKKIIKGYTKVNGALKLVYLTDFWRIDGLAASHCIGAFKFKGAASASEALKDLSGHGNTLSNSGCSWDSSGFSVPAGGYLDNGTIKGSCRSIVAKIASSWAGNLCPLSGGWGGINVWLGTPFCTKSFAYVYAGIGVGHGNGLSTLYGGSLPMSYVTIGSGSTNGAIGFTLGGEVLYRDGSVVSRVVAHHDSYGSDTQWTGFIAANLPRLIGGRAHGSTQGRWDDEGNLSPYVGNFKITAFAAYDVDLSQAQHQAVVHNLSIAGL